MIYAIKEHHSLIHLQFYRCDFNENDIEQLKELENDGVLFNLLISEESRLLPKLINGKCLYNLTYFKNNSFISQLLIRIDK